MEIGRLQFVCCGSQILLWNCPSYKKGFLNVHLICHSHDDAGWLKTVDQYFWGANRSITPDSVNYVLSTVLTELMENPKRKFSYAESSFFSKWWDIQDDITKHSFKKLVARGQFEFIGGGWVQHDEATTHYAGIIDQMTLGHRFLNTTFGRCGIPKVAWQIDPFGHSRESAALFALMDFEALFFARIHYLDRAKRKKQKSMEMIWHGSDDLGKRADILTSVFYEHYMPPDGFCFDAFCKDDPIIDDTRFEGYNVKQKVDDFLKYVVKHAESYNTGHIMLTMGGDFHYSNAYAWFSNLDKLIKHVNARQKKGSKVNVFYSTPTCYARAITNNSTRFPEKSDDFFPYAGSNHSYWTGYFTSRPTFKGYVRGVCLKDTYGALVIYSKYANRWMPSHNWIHSIGEMSMFCVKYKNLGIVQHHDGVSGTAKQHVTDDYSKLLHQGVMECQQVANDAMKYLGSSQRQSPPYHSLCTLANETICNVSQTADSFLMTAHNGLSKQYLAYIRVPVDHNSYDVIDPDGNMVAAQVMRQIHPKFRFQIYFFKKSNKKNVEKKIKPSIDITKNDDYILENEYFIVKFDTHTGLLASVFDKRIGTTTPLTQNFYWYRGANSTDQSSGAYIFRPNGTTPNLIADTNIILEKISGQLVQEIRQTFSKWVTQRVRLYSKKTYIEFEWTVGPIPPNCNVSKEIISRFDSPIKNDGEFFTDSHGRQIMKRKRNFAPTYEYNNTEPISANYYPVNTRIFIKDSNVQMTILTDRSQGGSSLTDGSIELMIHRRLFQDDNFGVAEPLNETGPDGRGLVATGKHWLMLEKPNVAAKKHRFFAMEMFYQPIPTFAPYDQSFDDYRRQFKTFFAGLTTPLPQNLHILTVAQWRGTNIILRFEHIFQKDEDHEYSRPVTFSVENLFTTFDIVSLDEVNLSVGEYLNPNATKNSSNFTITLTPMNIRTFKSEIRDRRMPCSNNILKDCLT
uniref:Alpha-mannosidase n=1 Tax=Romanomermis culicivorax TaxID=13658 RepID=A0A915HUZ6_ROMCU